MSLLFRKIAADIERALTSSDIRTADSQHDCTKCHEPISKGKEMEAFGTLYHPECAPKNSQSPKKTLKVSSFARKAMNIRLALNEGTPNERDPEWQRVNSGIADVLKDTGVLFSKLARLQGDFAGSERSKLEDIGNKVRGLTDELSKFSNDFYNGDLNMKTSETPFNYGGPAPGGQPPQGQQPPPPAPGGTPPSPPSPVHDDEDFDVEAEISDEDSDLDKEFEEKSDKKEEKKD